VIHLHSRLPVENCPHHLTFDYKNRVHPRLPGVPRRNPHPTIPKIDKPNPDRHATPSGTGPFITSDGEKKLAVAVWLENNQVFSSQVNQVPSGHYSVLSRNTVADRLYTKKTRENVPL